MLKVNLIMPLPFFLESLFEGGGGGEFDLHVVWPFFLCFFDSFFLILVILRSFFSNLEPLNINWIETHPICIALYRLSKK